MRVPKRQEKARFWELVRAGVDRAEAARRAGVTATSARRWFRQAECFHPTSKKRRGPGTCQSVNERRSLLESSAGSRFAE